MNDNLSEMIGKHRQNEIQDKSLCGVLLVKRESQRTSSCIS